MLVKTNHKIIALLLVIIGLASTTACGGSAGVATLSPTPEPPMETVEQNIATPEPTPGESEPEVPWPSPRIHPTMFFDPGSERIFMFGGMTRMQRSVDLNETWIYDTASGSWEFIGEMEPTDALINLGFDRESGQVIALNNSPRETWAFDLETASWKEAQPEEQPTEELSLGIMFGAPMAYDEESDRLILFGGGAPHKLFSETWAYDYNTDTWEQMHPDTSPSPRAMHALAYDAESDRVILWGGFTATDEDDIRIWAYDYNTDTWEALENIDGPQQHWERGGMVYIPELDRMLLFSGFRELEDVLVGPETWYYDYNANTWTEVDTDTSPPQMTMYSMVYDPSTRKVITFGGELTSKYAGDTTDDIWLFDIDESNWSQLTASAQ